ncbi:MAG: UDP-3-O-(3-hydroxymyristoyl)glucosamine N-acyltransferase [Bacteroidales bacterium]|nr:UDP-3-O-(3-hydroxymyristoyl)glucosamine N-acyltransferase [Bacteroidales bacterium]
MNLSAKTIADHLGGSLIGNPDIEVSGLARIEQGKSGQLCFLANPKYEHYLYTSKASVVLISEQFIPKEPVTPVLIVVPDAYQAIASLLDLYNTFKAQNRKGRSLRAHISWRAKLGKGVYVGPFAHISKGCVLGDGVQIYPRAYVGEQVKIGAHTVVYPGVTIYPGCVIGSHCVIHAGAVIGSDGFGFAPGLDGSYKKIPQIGNVVIEDHTEIGANTVIDRATMGSTLIRTGVKLDNLIQIGHNVEVGANTVIAAQSGVAGSSKIGENCQLGGQVGITGHIRVADGTKVGAQSGVSGHTKPNQILMGSPAIDYRTYYKAYAIFKQLPEQKYKEIVK